MVYTDVIILSYLKFLKCSEIILTYVAVSTGGIECEIKHNYTLLNLDQVTHTYPCRRIAMPSAVLSCECVSREVINLSDRHVDININMCHSHELALVQSWAGNTVYGGIALTINDQGF